MADFVIGTARDTSLYIQIGNTRYPLHISTEAKNINGLSDTIIEVLRNDRQLLSEIVDYLLHNTNLLSDYAKKSDITTVYKYKGSVNTYSALPEARYNTIGDVYNIIQADETNKINAGDNVVWTGTTWDNLAGIVKIDLSPTVFNVTGKDDVLTVTKGDGSSYNIVVNKVGHAATADSATSASKITNVDTAVFTINADRQVWMSDLEDSNKPVKGNLTYNTSTNTLTLGTTNNGQIIGNATSSNYLTLQVIPSNTDLNTITTPGEYGSNTDTVTGTLKNLPYAVKGDNTAESFHLSVFKDINTNNSIKQILMTQTSGREWYRYINGTTITSWTKFNSGTADTLTTGRTIITNLASTQSATFDGSTNITPGVSGILPVANGGTGSSSLNSITVGNAKTADVLTTGRSITTNLASTQSATFDGSKDVTPGVSGVLPVANGGTGSNDLSKVNVGSATKLQTARSVTTNLASTTAASFDGTANITPGVSGILPVANGGTGSNSLANINVGTATKLQTARTISLIGNATGSTSFDGSGNVSINTTVNESKHAVLADTLKSSPATETSTVARPVWLSWENDNTKQTVSSNLTYTCSTKTLAATNFKGHLAGNADSATKLSTARTVQTNLASTTSASFDGSANVTPGVTGILPVANGGTGASSLANITVGKATTSNTATTANSAAKLSTARTITTNLASTTSASFDGTANVTPGVSGILPVANGGTGSTSLANITVGKATADASGNNINSTYVKSVTYSGHTVTVTKGDGTTSTFDTADNNTTYPVATTTANGLMTSTDKTKLNGIATGAEVNQNAFSNITVGSTTIAADSKTDTLTLVAGSNITLTPDAANDKITISTTASVSDADLAKANAGSATKLQTARTIQTNLASTASASFDGTANITPGVSGILPVANGGTGSSSLASITVGKATSDASGNIITDTYAKKTDITVKGIKVTGATSPLVPDSSGVVTIPNADMSKYATLSSLSSYQTKLTFDNTPTADSKNPVTSDGIKKYIDNNMHSVSDTDLSKKVSKGGDTMTGLLEFNNSSTDTDVNNVRIGGLSSSLGIQALAGSNPGISLMIYNNSKSFWSSAAVGGTIEYNNDTKSIDFVFNS